MAEAGRMEPGAKLVLWRYGIAVCGVAASGLAAYWLLPFSREVPFLLFTPCVLLAVWYGGFRPAVLATALSMLFAEQFLLSPGNHSVAFKLAIFAVSMVGTSWIIDRGMKRAQFRIRMQQQLMDTTNDSILITGNRGQIISWNQGAARLYGWEKTEAQGKAPAEFLHTAYPVPLANLEAELRKRGSWQGTLARTTKCGRVVDVESTWNRFFDARHGEFILQSDHDVTERNAFVHEVKALNRNLRALSASNRTLVRAHDEGQLLQDVVNLIETEGGYPMVWVAFPNEDGSVTFSAASEGALPYTSRSKNLDWRIATQPTAVVLRTGELCEVPDVLEFSGLDLYRDRLAAAGIRSGVCLPLKAGGRTIGALNVCHPQAKGFLETEINLLSEIADDLAFGIANLRAHKAAEETERAHALLLEQYRQAQKMEAIGQLAGGIAHDFNNLLMVGMAQCELLLDSGLPPRLADRASAVLQSAQRAADLTRQLLAFSRKQVLQPSILNINRAVENISSMLQRVLGENIHLRHAFAQGVWNVKVDRSQLEQVLMNLAVNARDAMPEGGSLNIGTANLEIPFLHHGGHQPPPGEYVVLSVRDTGSGIPAEIRERIFEPFFTTKPEGKGTGLGLSTVYGIVKQSGGFMWVDSELGKGTCFTIYLPRCTQQEQAPAAAPQAAPPQARAMATILVVEDDDNIRAILRDLLSKSYHCLLADSVEEATRIAREKSGGIDLLLTDMMLRDGNGVALAKTLAENGSRAPVLFISGYTPDSIANHGTLDEDVNFLQKPFSKAALLEKVEYILSAAPAPA